MRVTQCWVFWNSGAGINASCGSLYTTGNKSTFRFLSKCQTICRASLLYRSKPLSFAHLFHFLLFQTVHPAYIKLNARQSIGKLCTPFSVDHLTLSIFFFFFLILSNRVFTNCTQVVIENYVLVQFYNCTSRIKGANKNFPFALNHFYSYFGTPYCISQNFTFWKFFSKYNTLSHTLC